MSNGRVLTNCIQMIYERTGEMPEVETFEELTNCLLTWREELAAEIERLKITNTTYFEGLWDLNKKLAELNCRLSQVQPNLFDTTPESG